MKILLIPFFEMMSLMLAEFKLFGQCHRASKSQDQDLHFDS